MHTLKTAPCKGCGDIFNHDDFRLDSKGHIKERLCNPCLRARFIERPRKNGRDYIYRRFKKTVCESCGFTGHPCQLDVDHIDGNRLNNSEPNLQTLCANCHRLKTWVSAS